VSKLPTSPNVCACTTVGNLKCQIEPWTQVNIWMINRIATNMTGSYCLYSQCLSKKSHVSYHIVYSVCSKCPQSACSMNASASCSFNKSSVWLKVTKWLTRCWFVVSDHRHPRPWYDLLLKHTPHGVVNRVEYWRVKRPVWPESGWDKIGRLLIWQCATVTWHNVQWWATN